MLTRPSKINQRRSTACRTRGCPFPRRCPVHTVMYPAGYRALDHLVRERPYTAPIRAGATA